MTRQKIRHIENVSKIYIMKNRLFNHMTRFDVIDIDLSSMPYRINHIKNIF